MEASFQCKVLEISRPGFEPSDWRTFVLTTIPPRLSGVEKLLNVIDACLRFLTSKCSLTQVAYIIKKTIASQ